VEDSLREHAIAPDRLEIELTESLLMEDTEGTRGMLDSFSRMGVRLAIDDFGTGHSSLSYLKRFNIDTLKIDRSASCSQLPDAAEDVAIATAVIALGRSLQMTVVAEGVETQAQADLLRAWAARDAGLPAGPADAGGRRLPGRGWQPTCANQRARCQGYGRLGLDRPMPAGAVDRGPTAGPP
jgi:predicted signal transduction protein with EAL and GGDEF domain